MIRDRVSEGKPRSATDLLTQFVTFSAVDRGTEPLHSHPAPSPTHKAGVRDSMCHQEMVFSVS